MKIVAIIFNIVLFGFTGLVLVTEGVLREAAYIVFTLLVLSIPILNVVVISRSGASNIMRIIAIICNIVLVGFICWALVDQYPHPDEGGVIANMVLIVYMLWIVLTPILSVVVLFRSGVGNGGNYRIYGFIVLATYFANLFATWYRHTRWYQSLVSNSIFEMKTEVQYSASWLN